MTVPGEHRHTEEIARPPIVPRAIDDAVSVAFEKINDRLNSVTVPKSPPVLALLGVRRDNVIPQTVRVVVGAEPRVDDVDMLVFTQLLLNLAPFEKHLLFFATSLLILCETHAVHA